MVFVLEAIAAFSLVVSMGAGILLLFAHKQKRKATEAIELAQARAELIRRELETEKREALSKLKEELHKKRIDASTQLRKDQLELERNQASLQLRAEKLQERELRLEEAQKNLHTSERAVNKLADQIRLNEHKLKTLSEELTAKLESISCMTKDEARKTLLKMLEEDIFMSNKKWVQKVEEDVRQQAKERSIQIVLDAMQRHATVHASPTAAATIQLPNEEMKGRIIGKEGRNIKALEMATGMEFIVGETPDTIMISGFNPIRREVARRSLEKLMNDGRINPTRIEETVLQCEAELEDSIYEYGRKAISDFNLHGVHDDIIILLGKLNFRTSFSQNVLAHSIEVARFARMIAEDLGLERPEIALRGGLLHDIGKSLSAEIEGTHAILGADVARRCNEDPLIVNAIAAHHEEVPFSSPYSPIVLIADALSAARPGARRETLSTYLKRLEKLEDIAQAFDGVKRAYALQAGREIRIIVEETVLDDAQAYSLARTIARKIETDMSFPGQIKVNVIRETRSIEYAR